MKTAPIPQNEEERLISLHKMGILDTKPEERFDQITRVATLIFNVPISTLTLVDAKREWFKSCVGLPEKEGDRAISFCGHALSVDKVFIVEDTLKDERFADNPAVIGKPYIRFYAGVPIKNTEGYDIGVFCIKDINPRKFSVKDGEILSGLGAWAEVEINSRNLAVALAEQEVLSNRNKKLMVESEEQSTEIKKRVKELELLNKMMVGRELKMVELKKENVDLKK